MSATWKARVHPATGDHQRASLYVSTEPGKWAFGGEITARGGDEFDALLRCLDMPLETTDRQPYRIPEETP